MHATLIDVKPAAAVSVRYTVRAIPEAWVLPEDTVPESIPHSEAARYIELVLLAWAARSSHDVRVARNLAIRWIEQAPNVGVDPDVCVLDPAPPGASDLSSLRLWEAGCAPPRICFEVVSENRPHKDYAAVQDRYAAMGTTELVVFDPLLVGPAVLGGPVALQLWRRAVDGTFERQHFGDEPVYSTALDAWLVPDGRLLRFKDERSSSDYWLTSEEHERAEKERERGEKERERADKERERADKEAALARIAELERALAASSERH